jgi:hypothetical protein
MDYLLRFLCGGIVVSLFAMVGDVLRPRSFAGLFGAAPSVALATRTLAFLDGRRRVRGSARSLNDCRRERACRLQRRGLLIFHASALVRSLGDRRGHLCERVGAPGSCSCIRYLVRRRRVALARADASASFEKIGPIIFCCLARERRCRRSVDLLKEQEQITCSSSYS